MRTTTDKAIFAAGCFWGVEAAFSMVPGVVSTAVGYIGGRTKNPTYQEVCSDTTGHAEAVLVEYDPSRITYGELLEVFWTLHDPTTPNRQGPDRGSQYRSAIFHTSPEQQAAAIASRTLLEASGRYGRRKIVTEIASATEFYPADEYHQKYYERWGISACRTERGP